MRAALIQIRARVFAVKQSLVREFAEIGDPDQAGKYGVTRSLLAREHGLGSSARRGLKNRAGD